jgi:Ca2+-dependent lipid-binding protein
LYAHEVKGLYKKADSYVAVYADGALKYTSEVVKDTADPCWMQVAEFYVEDIPGKSIDIMIHHAKDGETPNTATDPVMGVWTGAGSEVIEMLGCSNKYLTLSGPKARTGSISSNVSSRVSVLSESLKAAEDHGKLRISLGYFPVYAESKSHGMFYFILMLDVGILQLDIIGAENLEAVDGSSDPYCIVTLNNNKVFKTKQAKKTLNPVFNESCQISVQSRSRAKLGFEIRGK